MRTNGLKFVRCVLEEISPAAIDFKLPKIKTKPSSKGWLTYIKTSSPSPEGCQQFK